ncbi:type VII secretion integral membrane protein EccD [Micromonospora sp. CPCC 206060]|uniref:type VII secretion integral membrane protein EccD n=1 Tax=Micromonospora sp. CPCC 206060 TaxID=3122406 RepID=UPI002FF2E511
MGTGLARVTISAPHRRVDVALPEQTPLAELLPEVLRHAGDGLADDGEQHGGWVLRRTDGVVLSTAQALLTQGVRDGEVLHLVPARAQWPELEYDDVVEAIADGARRRGGAWSGPATRMATLVGAGVLLAVGLVAVLAGGPGQRGGGLPALAVAGMLAVAGALASRAYGDALAGATLAGYALPYAFVGGALLVGTGDPVGLPGPLRWIGAPELLAGSVALLLVGVFALAAVASRVRILVAGATTGLLGAVAALGGLVLPPAGAAAVLLCALVLLVAAVPLLAIRLGRVPMPPIALPTTTSDIGSDGARELPDRARVFTAVARSEEMLSGLLTAHAVLAVGAMAVLVTTGGTAGRLLVAVCAATLLLRSRLFVALRHRVPLLVAGLGGVVLLGAVLAGGTGPTGRLVLIGAALLTALLTTAAGATYAHRPASPYLARAADLTETALVVSVVPVACAVLGLYARARGLLG